MPHASSGSWPRLSTGVLKLLRRGSFTSVEELARKVRGFMTYYKRTMAKPFELTYQGKALAAHSPELSLRGCPTAVCGKLGGSEAPAGDGATCARPTTRWQRASEASVLRYTGAIELTCFKVAQWSRAPRGVTLIVER